MIVNIFIYNLTTKSCNKIKTQIEIAYKSIKIKSFGLSKQGNGRNSLSKAVMNTFQ